MRARRRLAVVAAALLLAALPTATIAQTEAAPAEADGAAAGGSASEEAAESPEAAPAKKKAPEPDSVYELRKAVNLDLEEEREENQQRLERFRQAKAEQERLLVNARGVMAREEAESGRLETRYSENEIALEKNQARLEERLGQLGELFGVVRQVSTDASGNMWASLTSAQLGDRKELLDRLGRSKELPSTRDLERLWYELHREMTHQGDVARFSAPVLNRDGAVEQREVTRAGPFAAVSQGSYLMWEPAQNQMRELSRQPPAHYVATVKPFETNQAGFVPLAVDPSRGVLLNALTDTPNRRERVEQGGYVGYIIISLGLFALLLGVSRWLVVTVTSRKVVAQQKNMANPSSGNPLGRVLLVYEENQHLDPELLELKLDDVAMRENNKLARFLWLVRTVSVIAPLLGLLGTVTGMIQTFQAITLYGAGDPKMMAGGISEALVTTMLGLITAIPLVLLYETLSNYIRGITGTLDEKCASLVAARTEQELH